VLINAENYFTNVVQSASFHRNYSLHGGDFLAGTPHFSHGRNFLVPQTWHTKMTTTIKTGSVRYQLHVTEYKYKINKKKSPRKTHLTGKGSNGPESSISTIISISGSNGFNIFASSHDTMYFAVQQQHAGNRNLTLRQYTSMKHVSTEKMHGSSCRVPTIF